MHSKIEKEDSIQKGIIFNILKDTTLTEFTFHTSFELKFTRCKNVEYNGKKLPQEVKFTILADWWFGERKEWDNKVKQLTEGYNLIEPDEPVLAYELACLRWTQGAEIDSISFFDDNMKIIFKCGKSMFISCYNEMDYSWMISECNNCDLSNIWSVICEDGKFFISIPEH